MRQFLRILSVLAICACCLSSSHVFSDVIKLNNGGVLRGQMDRKRAVEEAPVLQITMQSGIRIEVPRTETELYVFRSPVIEEYETRLESSPLTVEAQWELSQWCRRNRLLEECDFHLRNVVELDPEFKDARDQLDHVKYRGEWMPKEEMMRREGYVKHRGKYITTQEMALIESSQAEREIEKKWIDQMKRWRGMLFGSHPERTQEALDAINALTDPAAVPGLLFVFQDHSHTAARGLMIDALQNIGSPNTIEPLAEQSLFDVDPQLRTKSLAAIDSQYHGVASRYFAQQLNHRDNQIVRRAGSALQSVGSEPVVDELIAALVTTHTVIEVVAVPTGVAFGSQRGSGGGNVATDRFGGPLREGAAGASVSPNVTYKPAKVLRNSKNQEVLAALVKLTGKDFGYDQKAWRLWFAAFKNQGGKLSKSEAAG